PYGPLREPGSALRNASAVIFRGDAVPLPSNVDYPPWFEGQLVWRSIISLPEWLDQRFDSSLEPSHFPQKTIQLVSGIANPNRLEKQARDYGFRVISHIRYPDHHWFSAEELELVAARAGSHPILLTEKDAVRLLPLGEPSLMRYSALYVIRAEWCMRNEAVFTDWLLNCLEVEKRSRKDMNS
ncbi:hypothetical protein GF373_12585, partial [bacterium]|nr:hypothetical protein [bacterium]